MEGSSNPLQEGLAQLKAGNPAGAVAPLAAALKADPNSFAASVALGLALTGIGRLDQAAAALGRAAKLNPSHAQCRFQLGQVHERRGDRAAAIAAYQAALQIDPRLEKARQALAALAPAPAPAAPAPPPAAATSPASPTPAVSPPAEAPAPKPAPPAAPAKGHMRSLGDDDEMIAPLGAPAAGTGGGPQVQPQVPVANFMPPSAPAAAASGPPANSAAAKVTERISSVQSQGKAGTMEYWDVWCTAERAYFVKVASGVPLVLLVIVGAAMGALIYSNLGPGDTGRVADTYRNYALAGVGGLLVFVALQAVLMNVMAAGKRATLDKLPPSKAAEETGGFSMDWGTLRGMRMTKSGVTVYNSSMKKTFGFGKRMEQLDKQMKASTKAQSQVR